MITILCGLSGSGKTTWAKNNRTQCLCSANRYFHGLPIGTCCFADEPAPGEFRYDPAHIRFAHDRCLAWFARHLNDHRHLVVDNTNLSLLELAPYVRLAQAFEKRVVVAIFTTPLDICMARQDKGVPFQKMQRMHDRFSQLIDAVAGGRLAPLDVAVEFFRP